MPRVLARVVAVAAALVLAAGTLTACTDQDDDCDTNALGLAAMSAPQRPGGHGARGGSGHAHNSKPKSQHRAHQHSVHIDTDDCDDN